MKYPKGPKTVPLLGNAIAFTRNPLQLLDNAYADFGSVFTIWVPDVRPLPIIFLVGAAAHKFILVDNAPNLRWREGFLPLIQLLGNGLLVSDGDFHTQQRRLLAPALHKKRLEIYLSDMIQVTMQEIDKLVVGDTIDVFRLIRQITMHIVARSLFGIDLLEIDAILAQNLDLMMASASPSIQARFIRVGIPGTIYSRSIKAIKVIDDMIYREIERRKKDRLEGDDILSLLLEVQNADPSQMPDRQIRDQIIMLFVAGYDTTTSALTSALMLISKNQIAADRIREEVGQVLTDNTPNINNISSLIYLDQVINETLRLYPPSWIGGRYTSAPCVFEGTEIDAGVHIAYSNWVTHRMSEYFPNPSIFDPDRFSQVNAEKIPPYAYTPFGGGQRLCLGKPFAMMEMKIILSIIMQRVNMQPVLTDRISYYLFPSLKPKNVFMKIVDIK